jgi:hypothetical protein
VPTQPEAAAEAPSSYTRPGQHRHQQQPEKAPLAQSPLGKAAEGQQKPGIGDDVHQVEMQQGMADQGRRDHQRPRLQRVGPDDRHPRRHQAEQVLDGQGQPVGQD